MSLAVKHLVRDALKPTKHKLREAAEEMASQISLLENYGLDEELYDLSEAKAHLDLAITALARSRRI